MNMDDIKWLDQKMSQLETEIRRAQQLSEAMFIEREYLRKMIKINRQGFFVASFFAVLNLLGFIYSIWS